MHWPLVVHVRDVENVTIHEFGHQYWYGMVGSNEFEESWLDEGLNTDSEYRAMALAYGPRDIGQFPGGIGTDSISLAHGEYTHLPNLDPIRRCAWCFASDNVLRVNSYPEGRPLHGAAQATTSGARPSRGPSGPTSRSGRSATRTRRTSSTPSSACPGGPLDVPAQPRRRHRAARLAGRLGPQRGGRRRLRCLRAGGRKDTYEDGDVVPAGAGRPASKADRPDKKICGTMVLFGNTGDWPHDAKARLVFTDGTSGRADPAGRRPVGALPDPLFQAKLA